MERDFAQTAKQIEIMDHVFSAVTDGFIDLQQLRDRLSYGREVSKQALQCSIRVLEGHGLLTREYEVRQKRRRMVLRPTMKAYDELRRGRS